MREPHHVQSRCKSSDLLSGAVQGSLLLTQQNLGDLADMRVLIEVECAGRAASGDPDVGETLSRLVNP